MLCAQPQEKCESPSQLFLCYVYYKMLSTNNSSLALFIDIDVCITRTTIFPFFRTVIVFVVLSAIYRFARHPTPSQPSSCLRGPLHMV